VAPVRILIADDHEIVRKGVSSLLQSRENFEICGEAANGEEAVQRARQLVPDLVVLDVTMPVLDGISAAKLIRKLLPSTPILILSTHEGREMVRAAKQAGAQAFVTKSEVSSVLLKAVDAVLEGHTFFSGSSVVVTQSPGTTQSASTAHH
jgi:two-component system, NarL family, nitrate/nitrite response regulator NarL